MRRIIKSRQLLNDNTHHLAADDPLPLTACTVPLERWLSEREQLLRHPKPVGVRLSPEDDLANIIPDLAVLPLIALDFPRFTDGRGFSKARLLRERFGFEGELRAVGHVLSDQLQFMERCGMDAYELSASQDLDLALEAFEQIKVFYQPAPAAPAALNYLRQRRLAVQV
jgi:uncharacterized protein (DUF934 family)